MSYGELGAALPRVGSEYVYLSRAFGPLCGFLSGWTSFTVGFGAAIAAAAMSFAAYFATLMPDSALAQAPTALALALVWLLTGIHVFGVEQGGRFQRWITVIKIGAVLVGVGLALAFGAGDWSHLGAPTPGTALGGSTAARITGGISAHSDAA